MKSCYIDYNTRSIADLCKYYPDGATFGGWMIARINVPAEHRGNRLGSKLLKEICEDADKEQITLWLEIAPSGPLDYDDLEAWYKRYGFKGNGMYKRKPKQPL